MKQYLALLGTLAVGIFVWRLTEHLDRTDYIIIGVLALALALGTPASLLVGLLIGRNHQMAKGDAPDGYREPVRMATSSTRQIAPGVILTQQPGQREYPPVPGVLDAPPARRWDAVGSDDEEIDE